jgi:hypothetical protein
VTASGCTHRWVIWGGDLVGSAHGEGDSNGVWVGCTESEARRPDQRISARRVGWSDLCIERAGSGRAGKSMMSGSHGKGNTAATGRSRDLQRTCKEVAVMRGHGHGRGRAGLQSCTGPGRLTCEDEERRQHIDSMGWLAAKRMAVDRSGLGNRAATIRLGWEPWRRAGMKWVT